MKRKEIPLKNHEKVVVSVDGKDYVLPFPEYINKYPMFYGMVKKMFGYKDSHYYFFTPETDPSYMLKNYLFHMSLENSSEENFERIDFVGFLVSKPENGLRSINVLNFHAFIPNFISRRKNITVEDAVAAYLDSDFYDSESMPKYVVCTGTIIPFEEYPKVKFTGMFIYPLDLIEKNLELDLSLPTDRQRMKHYFTQFKNYLRSNWYN